MLESTLKRNIKKYLIRRNASYFPVKGGAHGMKGAPDMIACYRGRFFAIEGKALDGEQFGEQEERQRWVEATGGIYALIYCLEQVEVVLDEIDKEEDRRGMS